METCVSVAVNFVDRFASIFLLQAFEIDPQNSPEQIFIQEVKQAWI